jgi:hypothetical protein
VKKPRPSKSEAKPEAKPDAPGAEKLTVKRFFARLVDDQQPFWRLVLPIISLRLGVYFFTFVFARMTMGGPPGFWDFFEKLWNRWDVEHYVQIAENGYVTSGDLAKNIAFFPLYPLTVALVHGILRFLSTVFAGMLISNVASLFGLWYLHRLARKRWDDATADRVVLYVATFPTAYFFLAAYTEALFFLFVVGAFYYLDEEKWFEAALWAAFASATRLTGGLIAVCWLVQWVKKHGWKPSPKMWPILIAPAGFAVYLILNQVVWGEPLKFLEFQRTAWYHESATPWAGFGAVFDYVFGPLRDMRSWWYRDIMELVAAVIGYGAAALVLWKIGVAEGIYCLGSVILWTSNTWWMSGLRFCLVLFPMFLYLASRKWPRPVHQSLWALGVAAQMAFATAFTVGNWAF